MTHSKLLISLISILISNFTLAAPEPGYYEASDEQTLIKSLFFPKDIMPAKINQAINGSARLLVNSCSSFVVSNSGYVLTAAHCIEGCLKNSEYNEIKLTDSVTLYNYNYKPEDNKFRTCFEVVFLKAADAQAELIKSLTPNLISVGSGSVAFSETSFFEPTFTPIVAKSISKNATDYALLKFNSTTPLACIKLPDNLLNNINDHDVISAGEKIFALGFPSETKDRGIYSGSNGESLYLSYGSVTNNVYENQYYKKLIFTPREYRLAQTAYLSNSGLIMSNMDIMSGNSGSVAINSESRIVGINIAIAASSSDVQEKYVEGSALTLNITKVLQDLKNKNHNLNEIFDCK